MEESSYLKKLANKKVRRNYSIHPENVIFYDYFNNLKRKALTQGCTNLVISFKKIISSILKYPLPIKNCLDAYKLKGVGKRFSYYFEKALSQGKEGNRHSNTNGENISFNGDSFRFINHINKVISSADNFLRELDNEVYNIRTNEELSEDSILRNIKEMKNDYSNSNDSGNKKSFKGKKKKQKNNIASNEYSYPQSREHCDTVSLPANSYTYKNSENLNDYTVVTHNELNTSKSFLEREGESTKKTPSLCDRGRKKVNCKNSATKKNKNVELNDFERTVLAFLNTYGHLYEECAMSKEEMTIGFLKYYRNFSTINFRTLSRLIKLGFVEKIESFERNSYGKSENSHVPSMTNGSKSKKKVINKIKMTAKGKQFLDMEKEMLLDGCISSKGESDNTPSEVCNEEQKYIPAVVISSEDNSKSVEYTSTKMNESEEHLRREITNTDTEMLYEFRKCDKSSESHLGMLLIDAHGPGENAVDSLSQQEGQNWQDGDGENVGNSINSANWEAVYSVRDYTSEKENTNSSLSHSNYCIPFKVSSKEGVNISTYKRKIHSQSDGEFVACANSKRTDEHKNNRTSNAHECTKSHFHSTFLAHNERNNDAPNFELKMSMKKNDILKKMQVSLKERLENESLKRNDSSGDSKVLGTNLLKGNEFWGSKMMNAIDRVECASADKFLHGEVNNDEMGIRDIPNVEDEYAENNLKKGIYNGENFINKVDANYIPYFVKSNTEDINEEISRQTVKLGETSDNRDMETISPACKMDCTSTFYEEMYKTNKGNVKNAITVNDESDKGKTPRRNYNEKDSAGTASGLNLANCDIDLCSILNIFKSKDSKNWRGGNVLSQDKQSSVDIIDLSEEATYDATKNYSNACNYKSDGKKDRKRKRSLSHKVEEMEDKGDYGEVCSSVKKRKKKNKGKKDITDAADAADVADVENLKYAENKKRKGRRKESNREREVEAEKEHFEEGNQGSKIKYGPYEIVMVIDNRDVSGASYEHNEKMKSIFKNNDVKFETRNLPLGDIIWLCRREVYNRDVSKGRSRKRGKKSEAENEAGGISEQAYGTCLSRKSAKESSKNEMGKTHDDVGSVSSMKVPGNLGSPDNPCNPSDGGNVEYEEYVLKWIIERKTLNDLSASIIDGRYDEQKYRLMRSKEIYHIIYLIENSNNSFKNYMNSAKISFETLTNAQHSTQLVNGFSILNSQSMKHTFFLLTELHIQIVKMVREICHVNVNDDVLSNDKLSLYLKHNSSLWEHWNSESKKSKNNIVKEIFGKQLRLINMCGSDATELILSLWPTPIKLNEALNKYTHDGILAEKLKRTYIKSHDLLGKKRVKSPVDVQVYETPYMASATSSPLYTISPTHDNTERPRKEDETSVPMALNNSLFQADNGTYLRRSLWRTSTLDNRNKGVCTRFCKYTRFLPFSCS
ncbi:crossover junction endonuclease MUS81, putative (MUS81) [Plasmodium ovale curtisi]|uniref:Crossover junction endonuclease MUS81 n=1 Tax=Plasmodium ovale curtisi TaxID=864141 RepID=A0A1A8W3X2_PLAOA|nr:crossover junction endonuclease MUS81, putative (MUS81) [Plasmodium ovale curtisi]